MEKVKNCIVCNSDVSKSIGYVRSEAGVVEVKSCCNCAHNYTSFRSKSDSGTASANATLTTESYAKGMIQKSNEYNSGMNLLAKNRLNYFKSVLDSDNIKILEIGCGAGSLGYGFIKAGLTVQGYLGIELDKELSSHARSRGLQVVNDDFLEYDFGDERFDVICFSQVLEHINDPYTFIQKAYSILSCNRDSMLYIEIPNHFSLAGLFSILLRGYKYRLGSIQWPYHCSSYSKQSLIYLIKSVMPSSQIVVKTKKPSDKTFGQGGKYGLFEKIYFLLSSLLCSKSLIVATVKVRA